MSIGNSTIDTDVFSEIRTLLVNNTPQVTLESGGDPVNASIYAQYNDKVPTRPQIVIVPISVGEDTWKFGSNEGKKTINVTIDCYYKSTLGVDQLAQQVKDILKTNVISGIELVGITSDYAINVNNDNKYHLKSITFTYDRE